MSISRHQAVGAYRRWTPADFDAEGEDGAADDADTGEASSAEAEPTAVAAPAAAEEAPAPAEPPELPELPPDFRLPTAEEIERMHEEVRQAGFDEGRREGVAEGLEAGRKQGYEEGQRQAAQEAGRIARLVDTLEDAMQTLDAEIAEELMALAIEMARRMVRLTLEHHPETILDTVREALLQLPQGHAQIHLHPEDLDLVRRHAGDQFAHGGHRLHEDLHLQRGECRIEGQGTVVDATLQARWRRVLESIGHEKAAWSPAEGAAEDVAESVAESVAEQADEETEEPVWGATEDGSGEGGGKPLTDANSPDDSQPGDPGAKQAPGP